MHLLTNKINIRKARLTDLDSLIDLEHACFTTDCLTVKSLAYFIKSAKALVTVVEKHNRIIANAILLFRSNSNIARIYSIAVNPHFHGSGIAKMLIDYLEVESKKKLH